MDTGLSAQEARRKALERAAKARLVGDFEYAERAEETAVAWRKVCRFLDDQQRGYRAGDGGNL